MIQVHSDYVRCIIASIQIENMLWVTNDPVAVAGLIPGISQHDLDNEAGTDVHPVVPSQPSCPSLTSVSRTRSRQEKGKHGFFA